MSRPRLVAVPGGYISGSRASYANEAEDDFRHLAEMNHWTVSKRGWPDFLCYGPDGEIIVVEVKPRTLSGRMKPLRREQVVVLEFFSRHKIRCFVSDGQTLEKFSLVKHGRGRRV